MIDKIIGPFAIAYLSLIELVSGKPFPLKWIAGKIEDSLETQIVMIDLDHPKTTSKYVSFISNLKHKPSESEVTKLAKSLGISEDDIWILSEQNKIIIAITTLANRKIENELNTRPNILQKLIS